MIRRQSGRILNVSSMWGQVGASMEVAYSASKGGVDAFTKSLAKELAPSNIQVNALSPGVTDTEMNDHLTDEEKAALAEEIPSGRFADTEEAAGMAVGILTAPDYLTGQIIRMDGGMI
jgi:3-oxoacyl-[acyl-carrier protein] reductase